MKSLHIPLFIFASFMAHADSLHMANGIKIGEVSSSSAIVWMRLTQQSARNVGGLEWSEDSKVPEGKVLGDMVQAVPGAEGEVRVIWSLDGEEAGRSDWLAVSAEKDFTRQLQLSGLEAAKSYSLEVASRASDGTAGPVIEGSFRTAAAADQAAPVHFTVVSCQEFSRRDDKDNGHKIYPEMLKLDPDFFVHTGDIVYYDYKNTVPKAMSQELARYKWNRLYAMPYQRAFHNAVGSYFMKDDHDTLKNDSWPGQTYGELTWEQGLGIFREQVPMGDKTYRRVRWGKDLEIWMVEGRDFRSPNSMPDGPEKTIWGKEQKQWFFDTVTQSDATFRVLISPMPIVGPDRANKNDNHANKRFTHEGDELRAFIGKQKDMVVICGDRHWQYVSEDPKTGVREYSCGATTDRHAGGYSEEDRSEMHRYLKVRGGFLSVRVERKDGAPQMILTHHGVDGSVFNREVLEAK